MTTPDDRKPVTNAELHELWERQDQRIDRLLGRAGKHGKSRRRYARS